MGKSDYCDEALPSRVEELHLLLALLSKHAGELTETTAIAAQQFAQCGAPFNAELLAKLEEYGREFQTVHVAVHEATSQCCAEGGLVGDVQSLGILEGRVEALRTAVEHWKSRRSRQEGTHVALRRLLFLTRKGGADFPLIGPFKERVTALAARLADIARVSNDESAEILKCAAPYVALDRLVRERDVLTLEDEVDLGRIAETAVDREIVYAVARGFLIPEKGTTEYVLPEADAAEHVFLQAVGAIETPTLSELDPAHVDSGLADSCPAAVVKDAGPEIAAWERGETVIQRDDTHDPNSQCRTKTSSARSELVVAPAPPEIEEGSVNLAPRGTTELPAPGNECGDPSSTDWIEGWSPTVRSDEKPCTSAPTGPESKLGSTPKFPRAAAELLAADAARLIRADDLENRVPAINDLIWCLLRDGRLGLAYNLARYLGENGLTAEAPASLIEALILSRLVRSSSSEVVGRLRDSFHGILAEFTASEAENPRVTAAIELCAFAACLRPALLAPAAGAPELLRHLHLGHAPEELRKIREFVLSPASRKFVPTLSQLRGDFAEAHWVQNMEALQARCGEWLATNRIGQVIYSPTTVVWHHWLRAEGPIGAMIERVISNERDNLVTRTLREELTRWSDHAHVDKQLQRTDEGFRQIGAKRRPIDGRARIAVRERCEEAVAFVGEWLQLLDNRPENQSNWVTERARECRRELLTAIPHARTAITTAPPASRVSFDLPLTAAYKTVVRAFDDLSQLLDPKDGGVDWISAPKYDLHSDLLRISCVELDERWEPVEPGDETLLLGIVDLVSASDVTWQAIVKSNWERNDYLAVERILEFLDERDGDDFIDVVKSVRQENDRRLQETRLILLDGLALVGREIEKARLKGLIDENERLDLTNELNSIDKSHSLQLGRDLAKLSAVREKFTIQKRVRIAAFEDRLRQQGIASSQPSYDRICNVLESEDLVTANEYLAVLERGGELPTADPTAPGFDFFGAPGDAKHSDFYSQVEPVLFGKDRIENLRTLSKLILNRQRLGPIELSDRLTPGQAQQAKEILEEWIRLKNKVGDVSLSVQRILSFIGFVVRELREARDGSQGGRLFELEAVPIESRSDCILPDFGSRCQGRYNLLCLEGQPLEDEILRAANIDRRTLPLIAFFFGQMSSRRRRDLTHAIRRRPRRLLVLDDILLVYLCLQKRRLPAFFNAASEFCVAEPYTTTSSQIPPEMFFGRAREIDSVFGQTGTSLVYGGRQLGKTALLNEVRRRHNRPIQGVFVELIDLRHGEHLGLTRPLDDIWLVIASRLQPLGIVQPGTRKAQTIGEEIERWLDQDRARRIVLLLDEADIFLSIDANEGWPRVGRLKTLMEGTQRRFKVVFAGLHNVQRTSHDVNTPLAHMGSPICIGPFLSDIEMRDATDMVTLPFLAMGYRFQGPDLAGRILAQSNYYPSLIQIGCQQLLKRVSGEPHPSFDPTRTPPYEIVLADIEDAYADIEVRRQIRDRFRWTLELDNRYRVIALCLALETLNQPSTAGQGHSLHELRDWSLSWWPEGFSDSKSNDSFRSLLDEMCELGVLRAGSDGRFMMRSPNVISLLGTEDEILTALDDAARQGPKTEFSYEAGTFRRVYDQHSKWKRSPLTAKQESRLLAPSSHGLFVLFGTEAAGLTDVRSFLEVLGHNAEGDALMITHLDDLLDSVQFEKRIKGITGAREDGTTLAVIHRRCPWSEQWVAKAGEMIAKRASAKHRFLKCLFIGGPREAWLWSELSKESRRQLESHSLVEMSLEPWSDSAVRQWKKEAEFGENNDEDSNRFLDATGYWYSFLLTVGARCAEPSRYWKSVVAEFREKTLSDPSAVLRQFELVPESVPVLQVMAEYGGAATVEELMGLLENGASEELIKRVLQWADLLQLARPGGEQKWILDRFLTGVMTTGPIDAKR